MAEHPRDADLLNDLGNLLALAGNFTEAEDVYRRALEIDPDDVTSLYNLALVLGEQGQFRAARKTCQSIIELDPRHAWAHYQLGTLYAEQNNRRKAVHHYEKAFSIDRSLASPKVNPHMVENKLATQALLQLYVNESPSTQAPRIYEEPGNVADLLLQRESAEPAAENAAEAEPETEPVSRRRHASLSLPAAADEEPETESDDPESDEAVSQEEEPSVDSSEDDDSSDPESDGAMSQEEESSVDSSENDDSSDPGLSQASPRRVYSSRRRAQEPEPTEPDGDSGQAPGGTSDDIDDSLGGFTPGVQSTGRLDLELLPAVESAPAVSPT